MTIQETCQRLGKSESTIRRWLRSGKLSSTKVDGVNQIPAAQVEALLSAMSDDRSVTEGMTGQHELVEQLRNENEYLRSRIQELEEARERADTITLQLTRQLEGQQRLIEHHQAPWWRRWFKRQE